MANGYQTDGRLADWPTGRLDGTFLTIHSVLVFVCVSSAPHFQVLLSFVLQLSQMWRLFSLSPFTPVYPSLYLSYVSMSRPRQDTLIQRSIKHTSHILPTGADGTDGKRSKCTYIRALLHSPLNWQLFALSGIL